MSRIDEIPGVDGTYIDWARVNRNLRCPICGEKASIRGETDGTEGYHTHSFKITRKMALELSKPSDDEKKEIADKAVRLLREADITWDELKEMMS